MRVYFIEDQPKLKCREQKCENCDLTKILKNPSALSLPFPINNNGITRTYLTSKKAREVERMNEKKSTFTYSETTVKHVEFKTAWEYLFIEHPDRKRPFSQEFLQHRGEDH